MSRRTSQLDRIVQMDALSAKLRAAEMRIEELEAERNGKALVDVVDLRFVLQQQLQMLWGIEGGEPEHVSMLARRLMKAIKDAEGE